jgi:L-threonylcarbamoyladenylate synthase
MADSWIMKPLVLKIDPLNIDLDLIKEAARVINDRGLVAFPTETVYGLGANALDEKAAAGIFEAKKRPLDDPLIVHIADIKDLYKLSSEVSHQAEVLVNKFWPGPLTIVLKRSSIVPDIVTTGLDTVAVRMPSCRIARKLIEVAGVPIAAPSANLFGRPSPTDASHVINDLGSSVDIILDGGPTEIGVESTVVELDGDKVMVLRPGGISVEELMTVAGSVEVLSEAEVVERSPGKYPRHYSPRAAVLLVKNDTTQVYHALNAYEEMTAQGKRVGVMAKAEHAVFYRECHVKVLGAADDPKTCAARLFKVLREFDDERFDVIITECVPESGLGLAVMNRLRKAAGPESAYSV